MKHRVLVAAAVLWAGTVFAGNPTPRLDGEGRSSTTQGVSAAKLPKPAALKDYELGVELRAKGDYRGAIAAMDRALKADPDFADSWRQKGLALHSLGNEKAALAAFEHAVRLDPRDAHIFNGRASVRRAMNDLVGAMADAERAIELDPSYSNAYSTRAAVLSDTGNSAAALRDFTRSVELDPANAASWFSIGRLKEAAGDIVASREAYSRSLTLNVREPFASRARASLAALPAETPGGAARSGAAAPGTSAEPKPPLESAPRVPASSPGPARALAIPVSQFEEGKWSLSDNLWDKPPTFPMPDPGLSPAATLPEDLDINHLSPVMYSAAITTAREAMRVLMGPVSAEEEQKFEAKWAPLYEYPCQPVVEYFNKLNPLLNRFLDSRAALHAALIHFNDAWEEAAAAAGLKDEDSVREAMEVCRLHRDAVAAANARMIAVGKQIEALGEPPNPLAHKSKARRLHEQAMGAFGPKPFEGEWLDDRGERFIFKSVKELQPGIWLVFTSPLSRMEKAPPEAKWFLKDFLWIMERSSDGAFVHLDWSMVRAVQVFRPEGRDLKVTRYTPANSFNPKPVFGAGTVKYQGGLPAAVPVPGRRPWSEVEMLAQQSGAEKLTQYQKWKVGSADEYNDALRGSAGEGTKRAEYEAGLLKIKEEIDRRRATQMAQFESSLTAKAWMAQQNRTPFNGDLERKKYASSLEQQLAAEAETLVNQLRAGLGMSALQAAPTPAPARPTPPAPANNARNEAIALCRANQVYFQNQLDRYREDLKGPTADKERLSYLIMVTEANLQAERDNEATMTTGQWTRTRTEYDNWNAAYMAAHSRQVAEEFSRAQNAQAAAQRLLQMLPEGARYMESEKLYAVLKESTATGNTEATLAAVQALAERVKTQNAKTAEVYQAAAQAGDHVVAVTEWIKSGADKAMMALSFAPGGGLVYTAYMGATGYVEGGPVNSVKQVIASVNPVAAALVAAHDGYREQVVDPRNGKVIGEKGLAGAVTAGVKSYATAFAFQKAVGTVLGPFLKSGRGNPSAPTMGQILADAKFQSRMANGRAKVNLYKQRSERLADAMKQNAPAESVEALRQQAAEAAKAIKCDYAAKMALNQAAKAGDSATMARYLAQERQIMREVQQDFESRMNKNWSPQEYAQFSNSASAEKAGMDVDLGVKEPPKYVFVPNKAPGTGKPLASGKFTPNPAWHEWRKGLKRNGEMQSVRTFQEEAQRELSAAFSQVVGGKGRDTREAFVNFTTSIHSEAYVDRNWLGRTGTPHANFDSIDPRFTQQAADVTSFKIQHNPNAKPLPPDPKRLALTRDPVPDYLFFQEQCRTLVKDMNTKLVGSEGAILASAPLARAGKDVQQHMLELRSIMKDFSTNKIGPIEAERLLKERTGGQGLAGVLKEFETIMTNF